MEIPPSLRSLKRRLLILGGAASLILPACDYAPDRKASSSSQTAATGLPRRGGTLRVSFDQAAQSLDPIKHVLNSEFMLGELLFNGLTRLGYDLLPEPDLAVRWFSNARLDEWTFQLHPNVYFHDGSPLTAADVVATINAILDPAMGSAARSSIGPIAAVTAVDPLTVRFHLSTPYADLPTAITHPNVKIVRAVHLQGNGSLLDRSAVGTGPFVLTTFEPARVIDVRRNTRYFRAARPYVDRVQILTYPDATAESSALLTGGLDLIAKVRPTEYARIAGSAGIVGTRVRSGQILKIAMGCDRPPFNDVRVRQALAACLDRETMVAMLADGYGSVANDTPISAGFHFYEETPPKKRDLSRARALLSEAGYPNGIDLELVADNRPPSKQDFAVAMREMAKPAGIRINLKVMTDALYLDMVWLKGKFYVGNYEMQPTIDAAFSLLFTSKAPWNDSHWHDPTFDRLVAAARSENDEQQRSRLYAQAQEYMSEQTPSLIPVFFDVLAAHRERLQGFRAHPRGVIFRLEDVWWS
jgi:peptide/nickel transport system substrate-binding protein